MIKGMLKKAVLYIKEIQEAAIFAVMADSPLFAFLSGSLLYYAILPFTGILLTLLAVMNGYQLVTAANKNFDKWFTFVASGLGAIIASIALYGAVIASILGVSFAAAPWIFLSSVILAGFHQGIMLGVNVYRAFESLKGASQRMHYIQAAFQNAFTLGLLTAISGAITFVLLTSVAPVVGTVCALTVVALTAINVLWHITPHSWKLQLKGWLHLSASEPEHVKPHHNQLEISQEADINHLYRTSKNRLFTQQDHKAVIKLMDLSTAQHYIKEVIAHKIHVLQHNKTEKNEQKTSLLALLSTSLENKVLPSKSNVLEKYPLAFQSFWTEKGEVEQLFDAVKLLLSKKDWVVQEDNEYRGLRVEPKF